MIYFMHRFTGKTQDFTAEIRNPSMGADGMPAIDIRPREIPISFNDPFWKQVHLSTRQRSNPKWDYRNISGSEYSKNDGYRCIGKNT